MNESRPFLNESNRQDSMTKKDLKELEVITYTNNVHLPFRGSIIKTLKLSVFFLEQFYVG